jgi:hypothetical protein
VKSTVAFTFDVRAGPIPVLVLDLLLSHDGLSDGKRRMSSIPDRRSDRDRTGPAAGSPAFARCGAYERALHLDVHRRRHQDQAPRPADLTGTDLLQEYQPAVALTTHAMPTTTRKPAMVPASMARAIRRVPGERLSIRLMSSPAGSNSTSAYAPRSM